MGEPLPDQKTGLKEDQRIAAEISRHLRRQTVLEYPKEMTIIVSSGVAYLYGSVSMPSEKQMIDEIVRATEGVVSVRNHLNIIRISPSRAPSTERS